MSSELASSQCLCCDCGSGGVGVGSKRTRERRGEYICAVGGSTFPVLHTGVVQGRSQLCWDQLHVLDFSRVADVRLAMLLFFGSVSVWGLKSKVLLKTMLGASVY